jgi:hypothetical protein
MRMMYLGNVKGPEVRDIDLNSSTASDLYFVRA